MEEAADTLNAGWEYVAVAIGVLALVSLGLLYWFYRGVQNSYFIEKLLGLPPSPAKKAKEAKTETTRAPSVAAYGRKPAAAEFKFAEEFLARRTEFWLLYAQFIVGTFFLVLAGGLLLTGVIPLEAGLTAMSTVIGILLGKTLLSSKGTPMTAQEQTIQRGPVNVVPPSITGPAGDSGNGGKLTANPGEWSGEVPIAFAYTWRRRGPEGDKTVPDKTSYEYEIGDEDLGTTLSVLVTASNPLGSTTAASQPVEIATKPADAKPEPGGQAEDEPGSGV